LKELQQVHDQDVFDPEDPKLLTRAQHKAALEYLMFLKKRDLGRLRHKAVQMGRNNMPILERKIQARQQYLQRHCSCHV